MPSSEAVAGTQDRKWRVAVLIPCYNEEKTIATVVHEFKAQLPEADVYVFDNGSTDQTAHEASRAGAILRYERRRGKGYVIRSMFRQVDAEIYVMVDGDATYPPDKVHALVAPIVAGEADMVIGSRLCGDSHSRFKVPNLLGNLAFRLLINSLFHVQVTDLLSGYRAFSRRVVKGLPFLSHGFESETELTVKCLERGYRIVEIPVHLSPRAADTHSKIHIIQDGMLILSTILALARDYRPLTVFGSIGLLFIGAGLIPGVVVIRDFLATGQVLRYPSAILAVGLVLAGLLVASAGFVLHSILRHFQELDYQMQELLEIRTQARD